MCSRARIGPKCEEEFQTSPFNLINNTNSPLNSEIFQHENPEIFENTKSNEVCSFFLQSKLEGSRINSTIKAMSTIKFHSSDLRKNPNCTFFSLKIR